MKAIGYDIDWIHTLGSVRIHALSGGGRLPVDIDEMEDTDLDKIINEALSANVSFEYEINPFLDGFINVTEKQAVDILGSFKTIESNSLPLQQYIERFYARPFIRFATKGFISFDKTILNDPNDCHYHIVAYPRYMLSDFNRALNLLLSTSLDLSTVIEFADL